MATRLGFCTAGESHGRQLAVILSGLPAGLPVDISRIDGELARRQGGYGRGGRMQIESDRALINSGIRHGSTLGTPLAMTIENQDWPNWEQEMSIVPPGGEFVSQRAVSVPRPGHADLAGAAKFGHRDMRNVLERASARKTAASVAIGAICRQLLAQFDIEVISCVVNIAGIRTEAQPVSDEQFWARVEDSDVRCGDQQVAQKMRQAIDEAAQEGDTVGGEFEVYATGVPPGLGSTAMWQERLDSRLAAAIMGIPAIKSVEIGLGKAVADRPGSQVHDPIEVDRSDRWWPFVRPTNNAGGIEGGISNGEPIVVRAAMKPIPTLTRPLPSVELSSLKPQPAHAERSDVCAVPAASVVGEAMVIFVLAQAMREKFGGDNLEDMKAAWASYWQRLAKLWQQDREAQDK